MYGAATHAITFHRAGKYARQCDPISALPLTEVSAYIRLEPGFLPCLAAISARIDGDQTALSSSKSDNFSPHGSDPSTESAAKNLPPSRGGTIVAYMVPSSAREPALFSEDICAVSIPQAQLIVLCTEPATRSALCTALQRLGFAAVAAASEDEVISRAEHTQPDLVLMAQLRGQSWDATRLEDLRAHPDIREVPFVMLCEETDRTLAVAALEAGVRDVWMGPLSPAELAARLRAQLRVQGEMRRLREQVCVDELTGIFNRRGILQMLERETNRLSHNGTPLGILLVDIDDFKHINDTYGHVTGDEVLRAIGKVLQCSIRRSDAVGRIGGDEFLVVLPGVGEGQAHQVAERIRAGIEQIAIADSGVRVSASIGVAVSEGHCASSGRGLIDDADRSMYRRKRRDVPYAHAAKA
jgi:diguanylate cyclase (GGDEF)-like protein